MKSAAHTKCAFALFAVCLVVGSPPMTKAQDAPPADAGSEQPEANGTSEAQGTDEEQPAPNTPERPDVAAIEATAHKVRDLLAGSLDVGVDPSSLFDVDLGDENAIRVEVERLRGVIGLADREPTAISQQAPEKRACRPALR